MSYNLYLFAFDEQDFAARSKSFQQIRASVHILLRKSEVDTKEASETLECIEVLLNGRLVLPSSDEYFHALCWLMESIGEKITVPSLTGFRSWEYFVRSEIWNWFSPDFELFRLPRSDQDSPLAGAMTNSQMVKIVEENSHWFTPKEDVQLTELQLPKVEVLEILDSVSAEGLSVMAIVI